MAQTPLDPRIEALTDVLRGFVRRPQIRVLAIEAGPDDRSEVGTVAVAFEHHADNRAPFLPLNLFDCACARPAWKDALGQLQECHSSRKNEGAPLGPLPPLPTGDEPAADLSVQLAEIAAGVQEPAEGIMLTLALAGEVDPQMLEQLRTLVRSEVLSSVRFIVVAAPNAQLEPWVKKVGEKQSWFHRVEPAPMRSVQAERALDAEAAHGPGMSGAWPSGVKPPPLPRRHGTATEPEIGANAALEQQLSIDVRRGAIAMQQGKGPEALKIQTAARERCLEADEPIEAIKMDFLLGGYLIQLEQPRLAADTFERAGDSGFEHQAYELAARAQLNQGTALEKDEDVVGALRAYRRAIETGKGVADSPAVAIEAYRRAGDVALAEGLDVDCIGLWADAMAYAKDLDRDQLQGTAIKDIAKDLSGLLVRHRRFSQAREIDRLAETF